MDHKRAGRIAILDQSNILCYLLISLSWKPLVYGPRSKLTDVEACGLLHNWRRKRDDLEWNWWWAYEWNRGHAKTSMVVLISLILPGIEEGNKSKFALEQILWISIKQADILQYILPLCHIHNLFKYVLCKYVHIYNSVEAWRMWQTHAQLGHARIAPQGLFKYMLFERDILNSSCVPLFVPKD